MMSPLPLRIPTLLAWLLPLLVLVGCGKPDSAEQAQTGTPGTRTGPPVLQCVNYPLAYSPSA